MKEIRQLIREHMLKMYNEHLPGIGNGPWDDKEPEYKECLECAGSGKVDAGWLSKDYAGPFYNVEGQTIQGHPDVNDEDNPVFGDCRVCDGNGQVEKTSEDFEDDRDDALQDRGQEY